MLKGYYFITDSNLSRAGNINDVKSAVTAGVKIIQYRNKDSNASEMYEEALRLKSICKGAIFLINDRLDIALAVNADGIHIGCDDLPYEVARKLLGKNKIIGVTVHSVREAKKAQRLGADYIGASPIFPTKTKIGAGKSTGVELIKKIKKHVSVPVVAIGGINLSNAGEVIKAGCDGLCAISAVVTKPDVAKEIKKFQVLFLKKRNLFID
ncbi:MAG: thiamine phosphate synthase [Candidatus Omnitrophica bacterium CG07_land_8_20_14_0_80_42_15]|uniref:Thiamine-phosphate synthase n=1 Tax=Candidatus Aquitaenariimonas noxiae TaxID=1974741 RepID=A0A2J0KSZ9_9BACT|nr:MAG: thiamine phosphate synthase [Candidatus Omnitrophica bacterium CG07_land_8_20_14_0_80_42_15]